MWKAELKCDRLYRASRQRTKRIAKSEDCCVCFKSQEDVGMLGVIPCGHWVCLDCLMNIEVAKYDSIGNRPIECPLCRQTFTLSQVNWMSSDWNELQRVEKDAKRRRTGSKICFYATDDQEWWEHPEGIRENNSIVDVNTFFLDYTLGFNYKSYMIKDGTLYNELQRLVGQGFILKVTKPTDRSVCVKFNDWR
jgi:hypothetical protein